MRIALYIPSMTGGGAQRVMVTLANGLANKGINVDLVLNQADGPYMSDISSRINIVNLNTSRVLTSIIPLSRYLKKAKPEAILSAMYYVNIATVIAHFISGTDTKLVLSEHSNIVELNKNLGQLKGFIFTSLMRWAYKKPYAIVAVSNGVANALASKINIDCNKITTIYNPIFSEELIKQSQEPVSHPWVKDDSPPLILGIGRLSTPKDFETLIRAFQKVRAKKNCHLVILGEGELRDNLEDLVKSLGLDNYVQLVGFVKNPYAWMSKANLFVLSSIREGFGNVLVEAMACGTPVVSTDCPSGPSEILEKGVWGELIPPGNSDLLAKAIINSLENPIKKDVRSRAAFFSIEKSVNQYYDIFKS